MANFVFSDIELDAFSSNHLFSSSVANDFATKDFATRMGWLLVLVYTVMVVLGGIEAGTVVNCCCLGIVEQYSYHTEREREREKKKRKREREREIEEEGYY